MLPDTVLAQTHSAKTMIARHKISTPTRWITNILNPRNLNILHYGEGKALCDTTVLETGGNQVTPYDPNTDKNDPTVLEQSYDLAVSNYVFNTLPPAERTRAYHRMMLACQTALISVRTDHINGTPAYDGVITKRQTFQTSKTGPQWVEWFNQASIPFWTCQTIFDGNHFVILKVVPTNNLAPPP